MTGCIDDNAIASLLDADLPAAERAALTAHLDTCDACRALVAAAASLDAPGTAVPPGATLGRYVVVDTVGAGAMGVVYAAYDPELGRTIALKLVRPEADSPAARGRLLREAQALAKLAHPNVIAIHDVGVFEHAIFLAMELVDGGTLGDWLARGPRPWRAVVGVMRQVGEGLATAHAAGVVHRDLKPDNVLLGQDGRARVTDFGLSRHGAARDDDDDDPEAAPAALHLTATGTLVGTPAYMAPEQLAGGTGDERSDQYSFAATLYEALYGARPFAGATAAELAHAIARGPTIPTTPRVPTWLRRVVARGLAADPAARFPSLRALLGALDRGPWISPRALGAGLAGVAIAAIAVAIALTRAPRPTCDGDAAAWADAWSDADRARIAEAFARTGRAGADETAAVVDRVLRADRDTWRAQHREACSATRLRGEATEDDLARRMRCLGERRTEIAALARVFADADVETVDRAVAAALALPPIADCANAAALAREPPPPADPTARARTAALAAPLANANALEYAGHYAQARVVLDAALPEARALAYAPLLARFLLARGRVASDQRDFAGADAALHEAAALAYAASADAVAADAWTLLVRDVGFHESRPADARVLAAYAEAAIRRLGDDDEREALRLRTLATVAWRREGRLDEARGLVARARALFERGHGDRRAAELASCDEGLAGIEFDAGHAEAALPLHLRVLAARVALFGPEHRAFATAEVNVGEDLTRLGRYPEAIEHLRRALAVVAASGQRGEDAYFRHRLAAALRGSGDLAGALAEDQAAVAALHAEAGGYWESWALLGEGLDLIALGRAREAIAPLERAAAERTDHRPPLEVAEVAFALARALAARADPGDAARALVLATSARVAIAPDAARYGAWFADLRDEIDRWSRQMQPPR